MGRQRFIVKEYYSNYNYCYYCLLNLLNLLNKNNGKELKYNVIFYFSFIE